MPRWQYQIRAEPVSTEPESVTVDRWLPVAPARLPRRQALTAAIIAGAAFFVPEPEAAPAAVPGPDSWQVQAEVPVWRRAAPPAPGSVEPVSTDPETVSVDRWYVDLPQPGRPAAGLRAHLALAWDGPLSTEPESVTADRWTVVLPQPRRPRAGLAPFLAPAWDGPLSTDPETVTVDRWYVDLPQPYRPPAGLRASLAQAWAEPTSGEPESVTVDRWYVDLPQPGRPAPGLPPHLAPSWAEPTSGEPENVSVDRWHLQSVTPVWTARRVPAVEPSFVGEPPAVEEITLDRWFLPETPVFRLRPRAPEGWLVQPPASLPDPIPTLDMWWSHPPGPARPRRLYPYTALAASGGVLGDLIQPEGLRFSSRSGAGGGSAGFSAPAVRRIRESRRGPL